MTLSTITSADFPTKKKTFKQRPMTSLQTDDIDGARPQLKGYQYMNKPEFSNNTNDIEKSVPKPLHPLLNKPEYNLKTSDIDRAQAKCSSFKSNRITNPLNPVYQLPSFEVRPVTPPKFIRDSIKIEDISGAQPEKYFKYETRDNITVNDIEGARPKPERILVKPNLMDPKDINGEVFKSKRNINPLDPVYDHKDEEGKTIEIGLIEGSKSKKSINTEKGEHRRNLDNNDIEGARPGTVGMGVFPNRHRNYLKNPVENSDIEGCKPGTHKKGIVTKRSTNPLDPKYAWSTEEQQTKQELEKAKNEEKKISQHNFNAFWGVQNSRNESLAASRPATCVPQNSKIANSAGYLTNLNKFYNAEGRGLDQFKINSEKFFDNSQKLLESKFLAAQNPASIHRKKKEEVVIKEKEFGKDAQGFFGDSRCSFSRPSSCNSYQFKLSRKEIGKPGEFHF